MEQGSGLDGIPWHHRKFLSHPIVSWIVKNRDTLIFDVVRLIGCSATQIASPIPVYKVFALHDGAKKTINLDPVSIVKLLSWRGKNVVGNHV